MKNHRYGFLAFWRLPDTRTGHHTIMSALSPTYPVNKAAILAIILVSYVMIVLDISVVLTGLPKIQQDLGFSDVNLAWVQSAYTLTFDGFLLLGARAGDIFGRRKMFVVGLSIFTLASLAIGASFSASWMLVWRAIQGTGAAVLAPSTLSLLQTNFAEGHERTRAVSYYSAAAGLSATVGLILGGLLAQYFSWRVGFYINLPIGLGMVVATRFYIQETPRHSGKFDLMGALTSTVGMSALVYGFIRSAHAGWHDEQTIMSLSLAVVLLMLFVIIERGARQPILPLWLFSSAERSGAYAARILYLGAMVGFFFFTTLYLQDVALYGPALTGLAFVPATILHFPFAIAVPRLVRRFSPNSLLVVGSLVGLAVLVAVSGIGGLALSGRELMAFRVRSAFEAGTIMLVLASVIIVFAIVLPGRKNRPSIGTEPDQGTAEEAGLYANEVP